jgi:hypothetical protein
MIISGIPDWVYDGSFSFRLNVISRFCQAVRVELFDKHTAKIGFAPSVSIVGIGWDYNKKP